MVGHLAESWQTDFIDILCWRFIQLPVYTFPITELFQCLQIEQTHRLPIIRPDKRIGNSLRKIHSIDGVLPTV